MGWLSLLRIVGPMVLAIGLYVYGYSSGKAAKQKDWDVAKAAQVLEQLKAVEKARVTEAAWATKLQDAQNARELDNKRNARIATGLRNELDGLRGDITTFARGPAEDSIRSCGERATGLGQLLGQALRTSEECAGRGEAVSADLRAVLAAWPVTPGARQASIPYPVQVQLLIGLFLRTQCRV